MNCIRSGKRFATITLLTSTLLVQGVPSAPADSSKTSIEPLLMIPSGAVAPGTGTILVRTNEGVGATVHTFGLVPGNAHTLWVVIFNNPKKCATDPCTPADLSNPDVQGVMFSGSGQIAGEDGTADFGAFRAVGDSSGKVEGTAEALEKPFKAQIHLAVRSHGPASADPAVLQQQLTTFNGGCPPNTCTTVQFAPHQP
jgi:hypothetical protein